MFNVYRSESGQCEIRVDFRGRTAEDLSVSQRQAYMRLGSSLLDNLSVYKGERVRQAIEASGCHVLFLSAYSPDFTPIEEAFSKLKTWLRRLGARTHEALEAAIAVALEQITAQDARGWFWHCGYLSQKPDRGRSGVVPA